MHSSDETGDKPGRVAPTGGASPEPEQGKHPAPAHAFRERIRRASVAAAQATAEALPVPISSLPPEPIGVATTSSLPPEHSGVRDRPPEESKPSFTSTTPGAPLFVGGGNSRRMTPRAWPFAGGTRGDNKRPSSPPSVEAASGSERARAREATEAKHPASPGAYSVSPPSALSTTTTEGASWSPTSTKPQRASLLRTREAAGESGRYSVRETSIDYVDAKRTPLPPPPAGASSVAPPANVTAPAATGSHGGHGQLITPVVNKAGNGPAPRDLRDTVREGARASASASGPKQAGTDRSRVPTADHRLSAAIAGQEATGPSRQPAKSFVSEEDETTSRARRYTPKQRPAQRRGRAYERGSPGSRSAVPDARSAMPDARSAMPDARSAINEERAELARTLPDIRTTMPGRPSALQSSAPVTPDSPTQPKGRPVSRPPGQLSPATAGQPGQAVRAQSAPPPLPTAASSVAQASARESQPMHEASIVVDPELLGAAPSPLLLDAPARSTRPGSRTRAQAKLGAAEVVMSPDLIDTLPDGISEPSQVRRSAVPLSRYEPLPSDPAAFERLMRERSAQRGQPGQPASRLNWNQQETLLIPRESLRAVPSGPLAKRSVLWAVAGAVVAVAVIGTVLMLRSASSSSKALRAVPLSTNTATQADNTLIATEPTGAELLQSGAVLGNTPLEVRRPKSGEITYVVRLQGYEAESLVISPSSKPTVRVSLRPTH